MALTYQPFNESHALDDFPLPREINVGQAERLTSILSGAALAATGLARRSLGGVILALVGGALIHRGVTGHCALYDQMGRNTAHDQAGVPDDKGTKLDETITINRSPEELFQFWRNFENLARFMDHVESVQVLDEKRSHWKVKAPAGSTVEWDAEIVNEHPNELISWKSLPGAEVQNAGSVRFSPAPGGSGTNVRVVLEYHPPGGKLGTAVAKLFHEAPDQQIREDLARLKQIMESGQAAANLA